VLVLVAAHLAALRESGVARASATRREGELEIAPDAARQPIGFLQCDDIGEHLKRLPGYCIRSQAPRGDVIVQRTGGRRPRSTTGPPSRFITGWIGAAILASTVAVVAVTIFAGENAAEFSVLAIFEGACLGVAQKLLVKRPTGHVSSRFVATLAGVVIGRALQYVLESDIG
jgi:hypothetical protein